jgi:two-component system NtrC family response regulator
MNPKILIIDDDEELCMELSELLKEEGYEVKSSHDGLEGLSTLKENNYDLLLLDLKIPGMNGFDVLKNVKNSKPLLKVIVISGRPVFNQLKKYTGNYDEEEENILKMADGIISKPFDVTRVLGKISELMA